MNLGAETREDICQEVIIIEAGLVRSVVATDD